MVPDNLHEAIKIRAAEKQDLATVVEVFDEGFSSKFARAIKDTKLRREFWSRVIQFAQVTVAERGGEILGMTLISYAESPGFKRMTARQLLKMLGFPRAVRAAFFFVLFGKLDWRPDRTHAYLEAISVSSSARGAGVGSLLLAHSKQVAAGRGLRALDLSVVFENQDAKRLYANQGFEVIHVKKSVLLRAFAGVAGADVMRCPV